MDREKVIRDTASPKLLEEISDLHELATTEEWEGIQTFYDAFREISDRADTCEEWREFRTPTRRVHIALGEYVAMSQEDIDNTQVFPASAKKWAFKLGGVAYQWA